MSYLRWIAWLRASGRRYLIGAPKSALKKFAPALATTVGWRARREGIEVKLARGPATDDTMLLCRAAARRDKERAMHAKFSHRIEVALARLSARLTHSTKPLEAAQVNRQIGRLLQQNQRAAARFVGSLKDHDSPASFALHLAHHAAFDDWPELSEGAYLLRSNSTDWSAERRWKATIQLTQAEAAFRIQKDPPTATHGEIRLRGVTQPDAAQAALLERLGLVLPKRMRLSALELPAAALSASAQRPFHQSHAPASGWLNH